MGIKLSNLNLAVSLTLPNAYARIDRISGSKQEGQWCFVLGLYADKAAAAQSSDFSPIQRYNGSFPYADGNPVKQAYDYMKADNNAALNGMLNLTYTESAND